MCLSSPSPPSSPVYSYIPNSDSPLNLHSNKNNNQNQKNQNSNCLKLGSMAKRPTDEAILSFEQEIRNDVAQNNPLISDLFPITCLLLEYENNPSYHDTIQKFICPKYKSYRKCRGDGNCFYRAFSFAFIEQQSLIPNIDKLIGNMKNLLSSVGFDKFAYDDFMEEFVQFLDQEKMEINCNDSDKNDEKNLIKGELNEKESIGDNVQTVWAIEEHKSHALVVLMRLMCSAYLRSHEEEFTPFITEENDIKIFCQKHVECLGQDADQVQIISLANALGVRVQIAYLTNNEDFLNGRGGVEEDGSDCILELGQEQSSITINLLYRPGHYDLLYK